MNWGQGSVYEQDQGSVSDRDQGSVCDRDQGSVSDWDQGSVSDQDQGSVWIRFDFISNPSDPDSAPASLASFEILALNKLPIWRPWQFLFSA